jgi:accessory colonization factor AcfC
MNEMMKSVWFLAALTFLIQTTAQAGPTVLDREAQRPKDALHVYGPGGPLGPMRECANVFSKKTGIDVQITTGTPPQWIEQAKQIGDLMFQGAEYMLNDFMRSYPGLVDESSITGLYARSAAILVRKGNPKGVRALGDLSKQGMQVMVVTQERMEEVYQCVPGIQYSIVKPVLTGAEAARIWKTVLEVDAWITYESWHHALKEETDLVHLTDKEKIFRITPIAIMTASRNRQLAGKFIDFLKSEDAHNIFQKWGWR